MRTIVAALACLVVATAAYAASPQDVTVLPRPTFPPPAGDATRHGSKLVLVSSKYHSPADLSPARREPPSFVPRRFRGAEAQFAIHQQPYGHIFLVYGGRYLVKVTAGSYAFDLVNFVRPPNGAWLEEVTWARQVDRVLYIENTHLTYASATRGRNAYISAIDLDTRKTLWRSPALVANARTFVVAGDLIVSGYGFTAESDFLYLLDRRTGKVLHRLPVPSAPEGIKLRGDRLHVRTYDRDIVARIVR
ncbi:MAG: hypothetical protein H0U08_01720 [Actinobacteria bacterium]|nr:hypothetical protein [Actinomycetota bacterium]